VPLKWRECSSPTDVILILNSVPHITNAIQDWIERVAKIPIDDSETEPDVCVIELGEFRVVNPLA
jgi:hypothetical protein